MAPGEDTDSRRVVITGAAGGIGTALATRLPAGWDQTRTDRHGGDGIAPLDVTDPGACRASFEGADAVVHLAADPDPEASWEALRGPNVVGTHAVAQAAADAGVRRLVLASSLQALSAWPETRQRRSLDAPRPANLYGATKAWAEAIGSWIATVSDITVVALRIGHFGPPPAGADDTPRNRAAWLSLDDAARLVRAAVEGPVEGFTVVSGISANRHRYADLGAAEAAIGYRPRDDAWEVSGPALTGN